MRTGILFILLLTANFSFAQAIRVLAHKSVTKLKSIHLSDVVDDDGLSPDVANALKSIRLGDAPKTGEQRIFTDRVVAAAIRQNSTLRHLNFHIPHRILIDNRGFQISADSVRKELLNWWQAMCDGCQLSIINLQMPAISPEIQHSQWVLEKSDTIPHGHFSEKLIFAQTGQRSAIYWVNGEVKIRQKVPVLTHSVYGGDRLGKDDFKFEWRDVTYATDTTPTTDQMIGHQIRAMMNANQIIWRNSLVREKAVRYGQIVRVLAGQGSWQVSLQARTEQDGFVGDTVNVRNLQTNKLISGRVIAPGVVEVE